MAAGLVVAGLLEPTGGAAIVLAAVAGVATVAAGRVLGGVYGARTWAVAGTLTGAALLLLPLAVFAWLLSDF